jgi:hypothetical protein
MGSANGSRDSGRSRVASCNQARGETAKGDRLPVINNAVEFAGQLKRAFSAGFDLDLPRLGALLPPQGL